KARSGRWPIWMGAHPQLLKSTSQFAYVAPFEDPPFAGPISEELAIAENGDTFGHDVMNDWGLGAPLRYANVPIAPLYARDLAGRVLYIGRRPICPAEAWQDSLTALTPDHAVDVHAGGME